MPSQGTGESIKRNDRREKEKERQQKHEGGHQMHEQGRFVSADDSTMQGKHFDVARVLIRTFSWEFLHRSVKVHISGEFFSIRLIEDPLIEYELMGKKI